MNLPTKHTNDTKKNLPHGWRCVKIAEVVAETLSGFACGQRDESGLLQIRMQNLSTTGGFIWDNLVRIPTAHHPFDRYLLQVNDVLFNNTNSTELVGKSALFEHYTEPVVFSNHFTRFRTKPQHLEPRYLAYWFVNLWQQGFFASICNKWIGQSAIKSDKLLKLEIPLPPLAEQKRIASILKEQMASVDKARAAAETRLEAVKALPTAFLGEAFPVKLSASWKKQAIHTVTKTCSGATPSRDRKDYYQGTIPWVKTGELKDNVIFDTEEHVSEKALKETSISLLPAGTVLVAMYGQGQTRGRTALLENPCTTNQACFAIHPNPEVFISKFLQFWFMRNYQRLRMETEGRGGNQPNLNGDYLKKQLIPLPPLAEQQRIATRLMEQLSSAEKARASADAELQAINALPAALLRKAFNGER